MAGAEGGDPLACTNPDWCGTAPVAVHECPSVYELPKDAVPLLQLPHPPIPHPPIPPSRPPPPPPPTFGPYNTYPCVDPRALPCPALHCANAGSTTGVWTGPSTTCLTSGCSAAGHAPPTATRQTGGSAWWVREATGREEGVGGRAPRRRGACPISRDQPCLVLGAYKQQLVC